MRRYPPRSTRSPLSCKKSVKDSLVHVSNDERPCKHLLPKLSGRRCVSFLLAATSGAKWVEETNAQ